MLITVFWMLSAVFDSGIPLYYSQFKHLLYLRYKTPNEIGNHRQISPYVANYHNELRLFTHEVGMQIISEIPDYVVIFPRK